MPSIEETACHEAGHFVIGDVLGMYQESVTVEPEGTTLGRVFGEKYATWCEDDGTQSGDPATGIVQLYAGWAAQVRFAPESQDRLGSGRDDSEADSLLRLLTDSDAKREALERKLRQKADQMVADHWTEIEALAAELVKRKTVDADEATLIMAVATNEAEPEDLEAYRQLRLRMND